MALPARPARDVLVELDRAARDGDLPHCAQHRRQLRFAAVEGILNEQVRCDARCTDARGVKCECSCGGFNHGATYGG